LPLTQNIKNKNAEARIHNYLGGLYRAQKQYDKAIENYELALSLVTELNIIPGISACLTNLGITHNLIGNYEKALVFNKKALKLKKEKGDKLGASRVLNNLGIIYNNLEQYDKAENSFYLALKLGNEVGDLRLVTAIEYGLTVSTFRKGDFNKSITMSNNILAKLDSLSDLELEVMVYRRLSLAYGKLGEFEKAFTNAVTHNKLSDSLYSKNILSVTNNLEAKYQNEQKVKEIALLESGNELQVLQTLKRENERNYLIMVAIVILFLTGLLYNQYRIKKRANAKLKELDKLKSDFFANISHEFRTPLTLIIGPVENKLTQNISKADRDELNLVSKNAHRLLELINQLLDLSKMEVGQIKLQLTKGDIHNFLNILTSSFTSLADQHNIVLENQIPNESLHIYFDIEKCKKIVSNLLSNAFKFTPDGGQIGVRVVSTTNMLQIFIKDNGPGIPANEYENIFNRFYQLDTAKRQQQGTGIGLALVRELVLLHKGTIKVVSKSGEGAEFLLELPLSIDAYDEIDTTQIDKSISSLLLE